MPAFARKYAMSCTTCHAPFPRLKSYGDEFAGNGFALKDKDAPRYFVEAGDAKLSLIRELPFSIRFEGYTTFNSATDKNLDFTAPYIAKLISGGEITRNVSYYFYFFFSERGEVAGVEDAFLMFNNLFKSELDIYVGQFQVSDPLFKRELRLTYEDYQIYKVKPGASNINLAYDRGLMATYSFPSKTDLVVEILNGNGIGGADDYHAYDDDKYKSILGRGLQSFGDALSLGAIGYYGKEGVDTTNEVTMFGVDGSFSFGPIELNAQYVDRRDSDPNFVNYGGCKIQTHGGLGQLIYTPDGDQSEWYMNILYNFIKSDIASEEYRTGTVHFGYLMKTNIRLIAEMTYDDINQESRIALGFIAAF
jgi:hypothetical protein